jgi:hypothetical protein
MANKSSVLRVLELMNGAQLRDIARNRGLSASGSLAQVARRVAAACRRDLTELVNGRGSWTRDDWNEFVVQRFHGVARRSFEEIREEIERGLQGAADEVVAKLRQENVRLAEVRRDERAAERIATLLGTTPRRLLNALKNVHGAAGVPSLAADLVRYFQPHAAGTVAVAAGDDEEEEDSEIVWGGTEEPTDISQEQPAESVDASSASPPVTRTIAKPPIGHRLNGRWTIVKELGSGGMGTAFEVVNGRKATRVAKVAHTDGTDTTALVREAEAAFDLAHDNLCRYYDLDDDPKYGVFVVMQHCGESLDTRFRKSAASLPDATRLLAMAAKGIDYLHERGVVHGDVSPANILVDVNGHVRVTDFGISSQMHAVTRTAGLTHVGELRGMNRAFAADEVNAGQAPRRGSDQMSLAKVLCALLMGVDAFRREPRYKFQRLGPGQAALDRAMLRDHTQRHENCRAFVDALMGGGR